MDQLKLGVSHIHPDEAKEPPMDRKWVLLKNIYDTLLFDDFKYKKIKSSIIFRVLLKDTKKVIADVDVFPGRVFPKPYSLRGMRCLLRFPASP